MSIEISGLTKSFGGRPVLRGLNLTVDGPLVLMGPSGCGKTTLLRILMGVEQPDAGTVRGVSRPAVVFQENRLCPQLTAAANICLTGNGLDPARARQELQGLGFGPEDLALPAGELSGGQKRRAALLRALLCQGADTLLLDEPFTGMDAELVADAAKVTVRLTAGRPALLVTHDADAARLLGWPVVRLDELTTE